MKSCTKLVATFALSVAAFTPASLSQLNVPSDGSDGALNITTNTVIDLSRAVTGSWSNSNTANAGKGIYDPDKWAVVFKYSSVVISSGATVTFSNHPTHAPVVWLVNGDVTINGTLSLDGQNPTVIRLTCLSRVREVSAVVLARNRAWASAGDLGLAAIQVSRDPTPPITPMEIRRLFL